MKIKINSEDDLKQVSKALESMLGQSSVVLLNGEMGSGKTTFVKHFCEYLGVKDQSSSPTFGIVNTYEANGVPVYHFDLYRIRDEEELYDIGFEEYLDSGHICLIEWPEIASNFIEKPYILLTLEVNPGYREVELKIIT